MFAIQDSHAFPSGRTNGAKRENVKMPEILFPDKWWQLPQEDYNSAKAELKGLISKDPESGSAEVRLNEGKG